VNLGTFNPRARYLTGLGAGSRTTRRRRARRTLMLGDDSSFDWTQSTAAPTVAPVVPQGTFISPTDLNLPDMNATPSPVVYTMPTAAQVNPAAPANTITATNPITGALMAAPKPGYALAPSGVAVPAVGGLGLSTSTLLLFGGGILLFAVIASQR